MRASAISPILLLVLACRSGEAPELAGPAASVVAILGDSQVGTVHAELAAPVVVRVTDALARPVAAQLISWRVVQGGGSVFAGSAQTNASGEARERWTLGDTAGTQVLEARAVDQATGAPITYARLVARAQPGPLAVHGFTGTTVRITAETPITLPIRATDTWGNRVAAPAPAIIDTGGILSFQADSLWRFNPPGPGRFRFTIATETCTVRVHVPVGPFEYVAHRGDTTYRFTGALAFVGWEALAPPDSRALYHVNPLTLTRRIGNDSVTGPASPITRFEHGVSSSGAPARAVFINNPLTPSRSYLWFMSSSASAWVFAVGREVLDADTAWVRR